MSRRVYIARPRLDCSFKKGYVPAVERPADHPLRIQWQSFLDGLEAYHLGCGDDVRIERRALWQFDLTELQDVSRSADIVYVPHKQKVDFDVGDNALYYKPSAFPGYFTVDALGWGASMSWCPVEPLLDGRSSALFERMRGHIESNTSKFPQPGLERTLDVTGYDLFVCQIPHDETLHYHSDIGVVDALKAVLAHAEEAGLRVVVKGHPANPKSMIPLREVAEQSPVAHWVEDVSIHACLAGARRVYLVNSGVGFEAILHGKPITAFGRAEYSAVVANATLDLDSIAAADLVLPRAEDYVGLIGGYLSRCVDLADAASYVAVERAREGSRS